MTIGRQSLSVGTAEIERLMGPPIPDELKERYSVVIDAGCLDPVFDFPTATRNVLEMVERALERRVPYHGAAGALLRCVQRSHQPLDPRYCVDIGRDLRGQRP